MSDEIDDRIEAEECLYEMGIEHESKQWERITELENQLTTATTEISRLRTELEQAQRRVEELTPKRIDV